MKLDELLLTRTDEGGEDGYQYTIRGIQGVEDDQRKEAVSIAVPGTAPSENIFLGVGGMQADFRIVFEPHADGTDLANGTAPLGEFDDDTVVTLEEQRRWLRDFIHGHEFGAEWELDDLQGDEFDDDGIFLERVTTTLFDVGAPRFPQWSVDVRLGESFI